MKRTLKLSAILVMAALIFTQTVFFCAAENSTVIALSKKNLNIGDLLIVTITINGQQAMKSTQAELIYDSALLRLERGDFATGDGGAVHIQGEPNGARSQSYNITFTVISGSEAPTSISVTGVKYMGSQEVSVEGASVSGIVLNNQQTPENPSSPSSAEDGASSEISSAGSDQANLADNADLGSLSVNAGRLTPSFSPSITNYTVKVENLVDSITISAGVYQVGSTIIGTGTFALEVGHNVRNITVTSKAGTQKTYIVTVHRLTQEETENYDFNDVYEETLSDSDGSIKNTQTVVEDISALFIPEGFTVTKTVREDKNVDTLIDENGEYTLYYFTDDAQGTDATPELFYYNEEANQFFKLCYIKMGNKIYICEKPKEPTFAPEGYVKTVMEFAGQTCQAFKPTDSRLSGFFIVYCYANGVREYYRYDSAYGTIQREPTFEPAVAPVIAEPDDTPITLIGRFKAASALGKTVFILIPVTVLVIAAIIALLILSLKNGGLLLDTIFTPVLDEGDDSSELETFISPDESEEVLTVEEENTN